MFPSEKKRNSLLRWATNTRIPKTCFSIAGVIFLIVGLISIIEAFNDPVYRFGLIYPLDSPKIIFGGACLFFGLFFGFFGFVFFTLIEKGIHKGEINYPITNIMYPKSRILQEALTTIDPSLLVAVNGDWIDVTYNYMQSTHIEDIGLEFSKSAYTKMYRLNDDYTFSELDLLHTTSASNTGFVGASYNNHIKIGRIKHCSFNVTLNLSKDGIEPKVYTFNTLELTNYMHKWFADRGYKESR